MTSTAPRPTAAPAVVETIGTPDGPFTIVAREDDAVLAAGWTADVEALLVRVAVGLRPAALRSRRTAAGTATTAYYDGDVRAIDAVRVAQLLDGPVAAPFRTLAWHALRRIEPGRPRTYTELAADAGRPAAVRAAASACARNPVALFVPCHRVLRADGGLGGFAWGLDVKRALLEREAAQA